LKAVILCGGYGTRLAGMSELPKPLVPIGGRPILWHIMKGFAHWGLRDFVLCLGYRSDLLKQYFLNLSAMVEDVTLDLATGDRVLHCDQEQLNWKVTLAETGHDSKTGHRVWQAQRYVPPSDDLFVVTYGDGVSDVDLRKVVRFHRAHGRLATVTAVHPPGRFGELSLGARNRVTEFNEKPQATGGWISGGFFIFSRRLFDRLPSDPGLVLEREPLRELALGGELMAYQHEGFWFCVDTPRDYLQLSEMWSAGNAPWAVWNRSVVV
jgi:glucose-1-phosphate cytidylyltransferase